MSATLVNGPLPFDRTPPEAPGGHFLLGHLPAFRDNLANWLLQVGEAKLDMAATPLGFFRRVRTVTSPALANEVLSIKHASFEKSAGLSIFLRPVLGDGLLTSEHEAHARARRLLAPAFAPKRMVTYAQTMAERAAWHASRLVDGEGLDLAESMMALTLEIVGKTLFDAEVADDAGAVGEALTVAMEVATGQLGSLVPLPPIVPSPANWRYRRAVKQLDDIVYRVIRKRRGNPEDRGDVLSILLGARDEDGSSFSDEQIRDEAMTLFLAGHETTANALSWAFYLLARHPEIRTTMEAELDALGHDPTYDDLKKLPYTLAVLKETMRLYPPAYLFGRRAIEDVVIGGWGIRKNSVVLVNVIGIHRRADLWADPEGFDPTRFLGDKDKQLPRGAYLPFGGGPRVCIGNHFALTEGHLILATLARRFRFPLASDASIEAEPLVTLRPRGGIAARVERRGNSSA